jgi:hypothetical protein
VRHRGHALVVLGVLLSAAACSTSADDAVSDEQRLIEAVLIGGGEEGNSIRFDEDGARCAAARILDELTPERLDELGLDVAAGTGPELSQPPLTPAEGDAVYAALVDCTDVLDQLGVALQRDAELPADTAACVAERYADSGVLRDSLLAPEFDEVLNQRIDATILESIQACRAA